MSELLNINNLSVSFEMEQGIIQVVKNIDLMINEGETVAIVGESGAGKSQLFHGVLGLQAKNAVLTGSARFLGTELLNKPNKTLNSVRGTEISIIFQDPMTALNPYLRIGKQLTEVLQVHKKLTYKEAKVKAVDALLAVKIPQAEKRFTQYPHELSGGMRQRVMIAMALLGDPKLLIADEPTTALDVTVQTEIISLLRKVHEKNNTSIVLITHDIPLVAGLCDRIIIMYAGKIVETGLIEEIHQRARHPYTQALLEATPNNVGSTEKKIRLSSIAGQPPNPTEMIRGCAFSPRCNRADDQCRNTHPELINISNTRSVACFHKDGSK